MNSRYITELVVLSIVVACLASWAALDLAGHLARRGASRRWLAGAAFAMGAGIWSMHFIGMLAYSLPVPITYDVVTVVASLLIAVAGSAMGMRVAGAQRPRASQIALAGASMGVAIAGMHYTGMAAMRLPATQHYATGRVLLSLAIAVGASYAAIALFLRFRFDRTPRGLWLKAGSAIVMGHAVAGMHYTAMSAVHFRHGTQGADGIELPPHQIALVIAGVTVSLLLIFIASAIVDRWMAAQAEIRRSEARFRAMADALHDHAVFTLDAEGCVDSWNLGAERLLGLRAESVMGRHLSTLYDEASGGRAAREIEQALANGRHETEFRRRAQQGGDERILTATTTPIRGRNGALLGFARVVHDVTEKRRAEEELRLAEAQQRQSRKMEAVGQLAGGVAHDFNNMLTAIRGNAELLRQDTPPGSDAHASLTDITMAADRAAQLTRQLLAFSRKQMLQPTVVNPIAVVAEMERMLRRLLPEDVVFLTQLTPDTAAIVVDPSQLQQVILNLTLNARDALQSGGTVCIRTDNFEITQEFCRDHPGARPGPHVRLSVIDDGIGIPPDIQDKVFEPFFTTKPLGEGTGLGLSTVYGIVKQSGGFVWIESEPGYGATFHVCFPRSTETAAVSRPDAVRKTPQFQLVAVPELPLHR